MLTDSRGEDVDDEGVWMWVRNVDVGYRYGLWLWGVDRRGYGDG